MRHKLEKNNVLPRCHTEELLNPQVLNSLIWPGADGTDRFSMSGTKLYGSREAAMGSC